MTKEEAPEDSRTFWWYLKDSCPLPPPPTQCSRAVPCLLHHLPLRGLIKLSLHQGHMQRRQTCTLRPSACMSGVTRAGKQHGEGSENYSAPTKTKPAISTDLDSDPRPTTLTTCPNLSETPFSHLQWLLLQEAAMKPQGDCAMCDNLAHIHAQHCWGQNPHIQSRVVQGHLQEVHG